MKRIKLSKRLAVVGTVTLSSMILAACGGNNEGNTEANANADASNNSEVSTEELDDEPVTIEMMANLHTPETPGDFLKDKLEEKYNVELDIQWVPDGNYEERLNTAFATDTLPMVVPMGFDMFNQFKDPIRADQFWEIEPYLEEFENLSKLNPEILDNTRVDGKLYSLYQGRPLSRQGVIYRKDWADNLGIEEPTTTEEFMEMARAFTEDDPNGSGSDDTIGLTDRSDLVYGAFKTMSSWFGTPNNWGVVDGEVKPEFMFDEYIETMDFVKEMHSNGYMNQDFPVTSKDDQQAMFKNGGAGIYVGSMGDVLSIHTDATELNPDAEYGVFNYVEGPDGEYNVWAIPGFGSVVLFPKSAYEDENELRKVLAFYDKLMTPEGANLLVWGEEGRHYEMEGEGVNWIEDNLNEVDNDIRPFLSLEIGEPATSGRYEMASTYDVKAEADKLTIENEEYLVHDPTITLDSESHITYGDRLDQMMNDATHQYMLGQIDLDEFNATVEEWKSEGGEAIMAEFTESYQAQQ
ncbi:ABC transporter substrate-binding protein [Salipaludibacillus neizhouensis]|uniref:ABC transporter substrate-binding protein n=1 Tax=Salipaludibacillus neizhouensis TaxID=885475 RepID=A0A3A9K6G1_9BACI|nr:extracellular solute-binding protein [Salipaludibacillus neizhouensis]RKL68167.1 ABC transporter substrate-binding protein [Salipaludibacillus neizhouensis]